MWKQQEVCNVSYNSQNSFNIECMCLLHHNKDDCHYKTVDKLWMCNKIFACQGQNSNKSLLWTCCCELQACKRRKHVSVWCSVHSWGACISAGWASWMCLSITDDVRFVIWLWNLIFRSQWCIKLSMRS